MSAPAPTAPAAPAAPPRSRQWRLWHMVAIALVIGATAIALRAEGRIWWCKCGEATLWKGDVWSSHCSQHLADPYTFSHFNHGLIFYLLLAIVAGRASLGVRLLTAVSVAAAWEVAENSPYVIERYRTVTMSLDYLGDSVINAIGDVFACAFGFFVARALGWVRTVALIVLIEVVMLVWIRDNLTLNVLMLTWPVEAIRQWQTSGHVPVP